MISIIIPVFNQAEKLIKTLEGINRQTYQDYEVIIVNDGSIDNVEALCAQYLGKLKTSNHYFFINQVNQGAPAARNRGEREAKGEYLFFCDADAIIHPQALDILLAMLENNPSASYAYSSFMWGKKLFKLGEFDPEKLRQMPYIHTMALIRRNDFPAGGWAWCWVGHPDHGVGTQQPGGWIFNSLPYLEQQTLHDLQAGKKRGFRYRQFHVLLRVI